jgi:hypothetical protein
MTRLLNLRESPQRILGGEDQWRAIRISPRVTNLKEPSYIKSEAKSATGI